MLAETVWSDRGAQLWALAYDIGSSWVQVALGHDYLVFGLLAISPISPYKS